jgi:ketol-acid reductoisomerase
VLNKIIRKDVSGGYYMTTVYHDNESSLEPIMNKTVAVIGYGNQGRAQALNLRDSGIRVIVGNPEAYAVRAGEDGFYVKSIIEAVGRSDVVMVLIPDEVIPQVFEAEIAPHLMEGACVAESDP